MQLVWDGERLTVPSEPYASYFASNAATLARLVLMLAAGHLEPTEAEMRAFIDTALPLRMPRAWESRDVESWLEVRRAG